MIWPLWISEYTFFRVILRFTTLYVQVCYYKFQIIWDKRLSPRKQFINPSKNCESFQTSKTLWAFSKRLKILKWSKICSSEHLFKLIRTLSTVVMSRTIVTCWLPCFWHIHVQYLFHHFSNPGAQTKIHHWTPTLQWSRNHPLNHSQHLKNGSCLVPVLSWCWWNTNHHPAASHTSLD